MGGLLRRLAIALAVGLAGVAPVGLASHYGNNDCWGSGDAADTASAAWVIPTGYCFGTVSARHEDGADWYKLAVQMGQQVSISTSTTNARICVSGAGGSGCAFNDPDPFGGGGWGGASVTYRATMDGYVNIGVTEVQAGYEFLHYSLDVDAYGPRNARPVMEEVTCTPSNPFEQEPVTCAMRARDDSAKVQYRIRWGDGSEEYVPSGWGAGVAPGTTVSATHTYPSSGTYTASVTATDQGPVPWESTAMTARIAFRANQAPSLPAVTCNPNPLNPWQTTQCSFAATDDGGAVWYSVDFGDGDPPVRVPSSGTVPSGATQTVPHLYRELGGYTVTVTATDVQPLVKSVTRATSVTVQPNQAPSFASAGCASPGWAGRSMTCTFVVADDSSGVFVDLDWGDGTTERLPASGTAAPGTVLTASRVLAEGTYPLWARATDDNVTALSSALFTQTLRIYTEQVESGTLLAGQPGTLLISSGLAGLDSEYVTLVAVAGSAEKVTLTWYAQSGFADLNVYFYDADMRHLPGGCNAVRVAGPETCPVPAGAAVAEVAAAYGVNVTYTFRYGPA